ncbi:unnamed protein product [Phytomonas sp. EM1]|nr:unnamed protein product [Phytomonas sp. EM1]|eukprot:CCW62781.1 unnamed protein product [Phytomonas sp. isolate EM1]
MSSSIGDISFAVCKVAESLRKLKQAYDEKDDDECMKILDSIKTRIIVFPTFLNPSAESKSRAEELMLAREVLELAVLVSARRKDLVSFDLFFAQLQLYYTDISFEELPASPMHTMMLGLNLVRLLVMSRIAQFHSELEKVPAEALASSPYIRFAVQLERYLMEGSYNKLLTSRKKAPSNEYIPVVEMLESTVRNEVANCIPHAYTELSIAAAQKVLMVKSTEEVLQIGSDHGWNLTPDRKGFLFIREEDVAKKEIPFEQMINEHIQFAAELQKIV